MKKIAVACAMLCAFATTAHAKGDADAGQVKAATCIACHSADGNSLVDMYPKLAGQHQDYLVKQLTEFKSGMMTAGQEGRNDPIMGAMSIGLSDDDIADISAYYSSQTINANPPADADLIEQGHQIYLGGDAERHITACAACHGPDAEGMGLAGFPSLAGQHAAYTKSQLEKFANGGRHNDMNAMMRDVAQRLNTDDMAAVAAYISSLK